MKFSKLMILIIGLLIILSPLSAGPKKAPPNQVSQAIISACLFEKGIASQEEVSIYVMGNPAITDALQMYVDQSLGKAILKKLDSGDTPPAETPTILFLGDAGLVNKASSYCQENGVLSITNIPSAVKKGISLGIVLNESGAPTLLLNPNETAKEGKNWNPAIMKMAQVVK